MAVSQYYQTFVFFIDPVKHLSSIHRFPVFTMVPLQQPCVSYHWSTNFEIPLKLYVTRCDLAVARFLYCWPSDLDVLWIVVVDQHLLTVILLTAIHTGLR